MVTRLNKASAREAAREAQDQFKGTGENIGNDLGTGIARGIDAKGPEIEKALRKVADASGKVLVEQQKLEELKKQSNATDTQKIAQSERLAKAMRAEEAAIRDVNRMLDDHNTKSDAVITKTRNLGDEAVRATGSISGLGAALGGLGKGLAIGGAVGMLPAAASSIAQVAGALQQLSGAALAGPGIFAGLAASAGTAALGLHGMKDAFTASIKAMDGTKSSVDAANKALSGLAPNAADAVKSVVGLKGTFDDLQHIAAQNMFAGFSGNLKKLVASDLPVLTQGIDGISKGLSENLTQVMKSLGSDSSKGFLDKILGNTGDAQSKLTAAIDPIVHSMGALTAAGSDTLPRLATALGSVADRFNQFISSAAGDGRLNEWITKGLDGLTSIGNVLLNVGKAFTGITQAAGGGGGLITTIGDLSGKLNDLVNSAEGQDALTNFFTSAQEAISNTLAPVLATASESIVGTIIPAFANLASAVGPSLVTAFDFLADTMTALNPVVVALADPLSKIIDALGPAILQTVQALAPSIGPLADAFASIATAVIPLVPVIAQLASGFAQGLAPAISTVAGVIQSATSFLQEHQEVVDALKPVVYAFAAAWLYAKAAMIAEGVVATVTAGLTAIATRVGITAAAYDALAVSASAAATAETAAAGGAAGAGAAATGGRAAAAASLPLIGAAWTFGSWGSSLYRQHPEVGATANETASARGRVAIANGPAQTPSTPLIPGGGTPGAQADRYGQRSADRSGYGIGGFARPADGGTWAGAVPTPGVSSYTAPQVTDGGGSGAAATPYIDPSKFAVGDPIAGMQAPTPNADPQAVFEADSKALTAAHNLEQGKLALAVLEAKGTATQQELLTARNNIQEQERALYDAQFKDLEARQGKMAKASSDLQGIFAPLDQDFGVSGGIPGIVKNLVTFLGDLALGGAIAKDPALQAAALQMSSGKGGPDTPVLYPGQGMVGYPQPGASPGASPVPGAPYGLPAGTNSGGYGGGGAQFPDWVNQVAATFGVKPSTYPGHQESDRHEAGYAPNPGHENRGIDWSGPVDAMQRFADYLATIPGALEQVIWKNPNTGQTDTIAGGKPVSGYYDAATLAEHENHVHTRQSAAIPLPGGYPAPMGGPATMGPATMGPAPMGPPIAPATPGPTVPYGWGGPAPLPSMPAGQGGQGFGPGMVQPGMAQPGITGQGATAPQSFSQAASGGGGGGGVGISPGGTIDSAAQAAASMVPGGGAAAGIGIKLASRAIQYGASAAAIGASGIMETFLPHNSELGDPGKSWLGKIAGGIAGAKPATPNAAGKSAPPQQDQGNQTDPGNVHNGPMVEINGGLHTGGADGQGVSNDIARQQYAMYSAGGPR